MAQSKSSSGGGWGVLAALLLVGFCAFKDDKPAATASTLEVKPTVDTVAADDDGDATEEASEIEDDALVRGGETYAEYDQRRDAIATGLYSGGDECTEDCSGHDAGRQWAEQRGITDADDCGGRSWSFTEGCRSYAEEQSSQVSDEAEGEEDER